MTADSNPTSPASPATNPFYYGWRYVNRWLPDGRVEVDQVPLTLEDVLHPQEDDVIPERPLHELERGYLAGVFRTRLPGLNNGLVLSDCLVDFGYEDVRSLSPDVSVFEDVRTPPDLNRGTFRLGEHGGHCLLVIELVSPHTRENDVDRKPPEYHRVCVPLYIIVDQEREGGPRKILAYENRPDGFALIPLDSRNRFLIGPLGVCLGLKEGRLVCYDTSSGRELGDYQQVSRELDETEERARQEAEARKQAEEKARLEAEARHAAEEKARQEGEGRRLAETARQHAQEEARQEAEARRLAEEQARQEAAARQQAQEQARQEAEMRARLEERMREMEAELRRVRGEPQP
jgi:Uma2 family endonuclease